ncbi:serine hydrolase [Singulisphaera acidiphila]|uniref:D-alanyl-D-alanine dipeptidase n=1 Tax=Singulisphaera acidiphila (strain ATCC BAA-1392 / DSM 18658 / VKM B-2454 / MOB10) TaxID=886293 RepID=L0DE43_SINAD|nr:serine hydrolase [Singulisphaera acidiphila]AGA27135.1 D-alanyl-D-alanine dipeptidase [Singulisphaera acidiphila DSM 18658]
MIRAIAALTLSLLTAIPCATLAEDTVPPREPYAEAAKRLEQWITSEIDQKEIPGLSIALVDDQQVVWARGFGFADPQRRLPASAETIYRVGSVSKLFTDIAVMQLAEQGLLDLDAPVQNYLPEFAPKQTSGKPITLRQLMSHRSGLVRESPVGNYFDPTEPTLVATVKSLNETALVYPPEFKTKYSNAGIAVVGLVLEQVGGESFSQAMERRLLGPLKLDRTRFEPTAEMKPLLAQGVMSTFDGRPFAAPTFALGTAPAGNLYSNVLDLGRFLSTLFADGKGPDGATILKSETLRQMIEPQFSKAGDKTKFGFGFALAELDGHRRIGHGGAVYGFATEVGALPDEKVGVVVIANRDCANALTKRIADTALKLMLAVRESKPLPPLESSSPISPELALSLEGRYASGDKGVDLLARNGKLDLTPREGGSRAELRTAGDQLIVDDLLAYGAKIQPKGDQLIIDGTALTRLAAAKPEPSPDRWAGLIGEYGWDHNVLYIYEKDGKLHALIEWFFSYPLEEVSPDLFRFPDRGLYDGESLKFSRDEKGRAKEVVAAEVRFLRRPIDGEDGATFQIQPLRPVAELRVEALAAKPPREAGEFRAPELVDITTIEPTIKLDIRYASTNNFMGTPLYSSARSFMQRPVAEALKKVHQALKPQGYGILIHDSYRPWYVTKMFWDATPDPSKIFVANPAKGSRHNRGSAIDLTLYDLATGKPVPMVGGYDEFSQRSYPDYPGGTSLQRWHRELLRHAMEKEGFTVNINEWWHFDHKDWSTYPILNIPFEKIEQGPSPAKD